MKGRILGIKKTYILSAILLLTSIICIVGSVLSVFIYKLDYLWFFIFCLCAGVYQFIKGILFKLDSAFYFGISLIGVGITGFYGTFQYIYQSVLYILSFSSASFFTFVYFRQKFHLYLSILLYFITIITFLFKIKIFTIVIFVALIVVSVLIFILSFTMASKNSRKRS